MLHRGDRVLDAHHRTHFIAAVSSGVDYVLTGNVAFGGVNDPVSTWLPGQTGDG